MKRLLILSTVLFFGASAFACQAGFNWEQLPNTLTIHFTSTSTSDHEIVSYVWHFGDGQDGDGQNPNHTYAQSGTYNACLIITDNVGCVSDICHMVMVAAVSGGCQANFGYQQLPGTLTINFNSTSTSEHEIISYLWDFGDNHSADGPNPSHTYSEPGNYTVCLTITDNTGCVDEECNLVVVQPITPGNCEAGFNWEQLPNTLTIHFANTSTSEHDIISYMWNFGDGHNGDGQNPNHTYTQSGTYTVCLTITDNTGCTDSVCHQVTVAPVSSGGCQSDFGYQQLGGTLTINFTSTSTSEHEIISYLWNFGDGHTGDGPNPSHTYSEPGNYTVCLTITDNTGCVDEECNLVVVQPITPGDCEAGFTWEQSPNTLTINFTSTSTSDHDITSYFWNFGDNHTGDGQNPHHTYAQPGTYTVCLTITDNTGCSSTVCHEVVVEQIAPGNCMADFNWEQLNNTLTEHFHSLSTSEHDITSYLWDFGDGHTGDGQNPYHTYDQAGTYTVCLTITDNTGCTSTTCHEVVVNPITPGNCEAGFNWEQSPNTLTINFNSTSTSEHDIISYMWDFGDGHNGDGQNPHHTYGEPGTYTVCLTITDNTGCTSTVCHEVVVEQITPGDCQAEFNWEQLTNTLTEHFHSLSTTQHDITSYLWDFGDGHTGDGAFPYHTYDSAGVYTVCLTITDNSGCVSTICHEVVVNPFTPGNCQAGFNWEQYSGIYTVHFTNTSTSEHEIISYLWNFGDGHTGDGQNPNHIYAMPGTYTVCLTIADNTGCTSTFCQDIVVQQVPPGDCHAEFNWEQSNNSLTEYFHSLSTTQHDITSYLWDFGDGHMGDGANPHHTYEQPGTYTVCLTITDNSGCTSTTCHEVVVEAIPNNCEANFTWEQTDSLTVHFNSTSTSNHDIISYAWTFGDGGTASTMDPYHTYDQPGVYTVCLIITDNAGCSSDVCHEIAITSPISMGANYEVTLGENNNVFIFHNHSIGMTEHTTWLWNFGDGHTSNDANPHHVYTTPGIYTVCLTMTNTETGQVSTHCEDIMYGMQVSEYGPGMGINHTVASSTHANAFTTPLVDFRYSNPVKDELYLHFSLSDDAQVGMELYDLSGRRVIRIDQVMESQGVHDQTIPTATLIPGLYALHLMVGHERIVRTVLITQ